MVTSKALRSIAVGWLLASHSIASGAVDCEARCPDRNVGIAFASGQPLFVSPPTVGAGFSGCQIAWDSVGNRQMTLRFRDGSLVEADFNVPTVSPSRVRCTFEGSRIMSGPSECADIQSSSGRGGVSSVPLSEFAEKAKDEVKVQWGPNECTPSLVRVNVPARPVPPTPSLDLLAGTWVGLNQVQEGSNTRAAVVQRLVLSKDGTGFLSTTIIATGNTYTKPITRTEITEHRVFFYGAHFPGEVSTWGQLSIQDAYGKTQLMREGDFLRGLRATADDIGKARSATASEMNK